MSAEKDANKEIYKKILATILNNIQESGVNDDETVWLIGDLASRLLDKTAIPSWERMKQALSNEAYDGLLLSFQEQGAKSLSDGNHKAAYAMQALGCSVIGSRMNDPEIATGVRLLDDFINAAINYYRKGSAARTDDGLGTSTTH